MAKAKTAPVLYACTECGYSSGRWFGKCPSCGTFGSLVEERAEQSGPAQQTSRPLVKLRADRLGGSAGIEILAETELETVCATLETERPDVCVVDSVQTLYASELGSAPGSVAQVREA